MEHPGPVLIDLHLHTTASDGRCTPRELVEQAAAAGVAIMAATDHDTTAAIADVRAHAEARGIEAIAGIEITAIHDGVDVHMLGYFFDPSNARLDAFLAAQRETRLRRVEAIAQRLTELGMPVDATPIVRSAREQAGRSVGRPQIARALIDAGFAADMRDAFDRWLGRGCPAFVPRSGPAPADVVEIVHHAGGLVSMAHPGRTALDALIAPLADAGLDALEVYHSDHDGAAIARYSALARELDLLVTGGSDYHGDPARTLRPGATTLPADEWQRLRAAVPRHA